MRVLSCLAKRAETGSYPLCAAVCRPSFITQYYVDIMAICRAYMYEAWLYHVQLVTRIA